MLKPTRPLLLALFALLCVAISTTHAASFDCNKARSLMEKTICADMQLSALDDELNAVYQKTLEFAGNKAVIRRWQRDWLRSDDLKHCEDAACWIPLFSERIATLKNVAGSQDRASHWHGHYVRTYAGRQNGSITLIGLTGNRVLADGYALWDGPDAANGQIHTGMLDGIGLLVANKTVFDLDGCTATLVLDAKGIVVEDESGCGGLNVSFIGEYRRVD